MEYLNKRVEFKLPISKKDIYRYDISDSEYAIGEGIILDNLPNNKYRISITFPSRMKNKELVVDINDIIRIRPYYQMKSPHPPLYTGPRHPCEFNDDGVCDKKCEGISNRKCNFDSNHFLQCLEAKRRNFEPELRKKKITSKLKRKTCRCKK